VADEVYERYRRLVGEPVPPALDVALCWTAGFLTGIELATGVRLDRRWLDAEHPYLTLCGPIPD
jgi:hypothetical protein